MDKVWRYTSKSIDVAEDHNKLVKFNCVDCNEPATAPSGTARAKQKKCKDCFGKRADNRKNVLNDLTGAEWASLSKSVEQYPGTRSEKQKAHGAAFPISLAEAHIKIYSKKDDLVFDPFLGVGTTADAAALTDRRSVGIELSPEFAKLAARPKAEQRRHKVICDDVRNMHMHLRASSVDLVLTSPPYATLLKSIKGNFAYKWREHSDLTVVANPQAYSEHSSDLGNLQYSEFMDELARVHAGCYRVLKSDSYSVWVVKDYRDLKGGKPYVNFHGDVIVAAEKAGFVLWDLRIYDQTKFRPLVVLGYPSRNYYMNIGHSYILVFKKIASK